MTPRHRQICRPLAGSKTAFARRCLKDRSFRGVITKGMRALVRREIAHLTSDNMASILNSTSSHILNEFTWDDLLAEVKSAAPTLLELLQGCTKAKTPRKNQNATMGVLIAIMCEHRRPTSSLVQRLFSLILYSGHASKRVGINCFMFTHIILFYFIRPLSVFTKLDCASLIVAQSSW